MKLQEFLYGLFGGAGITDPLALNVGVGVFVGLVATVFFFSVIFWLQRVVRFLLSFFFDR
ncbi:MAG: hypothetical protein EOP24_29025 [Hyphomicrobiales bacterium]|nr:MAG: hypothetical protein EOP24_29025 [Hyphomicrobiales bacterium]